MSDRRAASPGKSSRHLSRVVLSAGMLLVIVLAAFLGVTSRSLAATSRPGGNIQDSTVLNIDIARPAVVRLADLFRASLTVQLCSGKTATISDLNSGLPLGGLGSGAFIDSHGDILTADHVVDGSRDWLLSIAFEEFAPQIAADLFSECGIPETSDQVLQDPNITIIGGSTSDLTYKMWLDSSYAGAYPATTYADYVSFIENSTPSYTFTVSASSFVSQNDVAIIHTNLTDTPSIALGDDASVSPTDLLTIIGYPGNGDTTLSSGSYNLNDILTESLNQVYVSAVKTNDSNGTLIQVGGNVEHGDSGGPALNAQGQIVGVVSFLGGADTPVGTSFFQGSSSAKKLVTQLGLDLTAGAFETSWRQALTDYASTSSGHWHKAAGDLAAIQQKYPLFKGVTDYLTNAQQNAQTESAATTTTSTNTSTLNATLVIAIGSIALLVLLVLIMYFVISGNRHAAKQRAVAAAQEAMAVPVPVGGTATSGYYGYGSGYPPGYGGQYAPPASGYPFSGYPQSGYPPPAAPSAPNTPWSSPGASAQTGDRSPTPGDAQAGPRSSTSSSTVCMHGHPMQPNESYCSICRAPRAQ